MWCFHRYNLRIHVIVRAFSKLTNTYCLVARGFLKNAIDKKVSSGEIIPTEIIDSTPVNTEIMVIIQEIYEATNNIRRKACTCEIEHIKC